MMISFAKAEPILAILAGGAVLLPALFETLAAFGHPLTDPQQHALVAIATAIGALIARSQVTPK